MTVIKNFIFRNKLQPGHIITPKSNTETVNGAQINPLIYIGVRAFQSGKRQHIFALKDPSKVTFIGEKRMLQVLHEYYPDELDNCYDNLPANPVNISNRAFEINRISQDENCLLWYNWVDYINHVKAKPIQKIKRDGIFKRVVMGLSVFTDIIRGNTYVPKTLPDKQAS